MLRAWLPIVVAVAACDQGAKVQQEPPAPPRSPGTIRGTLIGEGSSPVEDDPDPPPVRLPNVVVRVTGRTGVQTTTSDAAGKYALELAPGAYWLAFEGCLQPRPEPPARVTIEAGGVVDVSLTCTMIYK